MDSSYLIAALSRSEQIVPALVADLPDAALRWKPPNDAWSILEVLCHLGDEEVGDFRERLKLTLSSPSTEWPPIDPPGWAVQRKYNEQSTTEALTRFTSERGESVRWLTTLVNPDWSRTYQHPKLGDIRAGDLLAAWAAHDALHLRQISKRIYQLTQLHAGEFSTSYAGEWTA